MKGLVLILGFFIYSTVLFLLSDFKVLGLLALLEFALLLLLTKRYWRAAISFLAKNCGFVAFVVVCNLLFADLQSSLLVGVRLGLAIIATYIISQCLSAQELAQGITKLCAPLRLFKIDVDELALSITVAFTLVPILAREAKLLQSNLKLKGCGWKTLCLQPQVYIVGLVNQLFVRASAMEQALRLKGYN